MYNAKKQHMKKALLRKVEEKKQIKEQFELQDEFVLKADFLLDYNIKPRDILDLIVMKINCNTLCDT